MLFNNAGISPLDDASVLDTDGRGLAARAGRQPQVDLPVLQARDPAPARDRRRLGHQHRLVRRGHGRGDVADLLHRLQGRRARDVARAGDRVRPPRRARQRALPRAGRHAAAARALRQRPRGGGAAHGPRADGPLRGGGRARQRGRVPGLGRSLATSPRRRSSSTAGCPAPTSRRCSGNHTPRSPACPTRGPRDAGRDFLHDVDRTPPRPPDLRGGHGGGDRPSARRRPAEPAQRRLRRALDADRGGDPGRRRRALRPPRDVGARRARGPVRPRRPRRRPRHARPSRARPRRERQRLHRLRPGGGGRGAAGAGASVLALA